MITARAGHTATMLTNGNVLIAGGAVGASASSCELYLPGNAPPAGLVSIAIAPSGATMSSGGTQQFVATGTFSDNSTEVLQSAIWSSSNQAVVAISNDASNHGIALAVATGNFRDHRQRRISHRLYCANCAVNLSNDVQPCE